jgi:hypothetical protein
METVSPFALLAARVGINLWLPASVLMALFCLVGLHRKVGAPRSELASKLLALAWLANVALTIVTLMIGRGEAAGALMFLIGMVVAPVYLALIVAGMVAAGAEFAAMFRHRTSTPSCIPVALLSWAVLPPLVSLLPLLFAPSNPLVISAREDAEFAELCKDVGVRLMEKPVSAVRSIAYDSNPWGVFGHSWERIEMDGSNRVRGYGCCSKIDSAEYQKKQAFEFTERRPADGLAGRATVNPDAPYYRFPDVSTKQPYYGVESLSADVLAFLEVDKADELRKARVLQGAIRYKLTLTDRRSGAVLGVQSYVVDQVNKRACGANIDNTISQKAFIYDAIHR